MSSRTAKQLYTDLRVLTEKSTTNHVLPTLATLFNANLAEAKKHFPSDPIITVIPNATPQMINIDVMVMAGQLMEALDEAEGSQEL